MSHRLCINNAFNRFSLTTIKKPFESPFFHLNNDGCCRSRNPLCIARADGKTASTAWFWNSVSFYLELDCISKWSNWTDYFFTIFINGDANFDISNDANIIGIDMVVFWTRAPATGYKAPWIHGHIHPGRLVRLTGLNCRNGPEIPARHHLVEEIGLIRSPLSRHYMFELGLFWIFVTNITLSVTLWHRCHQRKHVASSINISMI